MTTKTSDYDVIVIGGGSGGIACARESARLGAKVALFDYVKPSLKGTVWGLGGTCVNVGCIPKKLMHYTSLLKPHIENAKVLGWNINIGKTPHSWEKMVQTVQNHIKSLNFGYRTDYFIKNSYFNRQATFTGPQNIKYRTKQDEDKHLSAKNIVIAVGTRPEYLKIPNAELGITSDDIFSLKKPPGKTLIIGGSYIAFETAGFLAELGFDVTVAIRSIAFRNFDRECVKCIVDHIQKIGTKLKFNVIPVRLDKDEGGKIKVLFKSNKTGEENEEIFDTVMFASGRKANVEGLGLEHANVKTLPNGKIHTVDEQTSNPRVYAIGDIIDRLELTPVAIQAGVLLARRILGESDVKMNYNLVPTTIFTPLEYGCIGLTEEKAIEIHGKQNISVYLSSYASLENKACHRTTKEGEEFGNTNLAKLVCLKLDDERVIGFHYVGENAGEVTGGYAVAMRLRATKKDFDGTVGIHPTSGESFTTLRVTRESGEDFEASGC